MGRTLVVAPKPLSKQKSIIRDFFVLVKIRFSLERFPKKNCASTFENLYVCASEMFNPVKNPKAK
jgi:hypothetical protein